MAAGVETNLGRQFDLPLCAIYRSVHLRPIEPADLPLLREFVRRLSPGTGYKRLLSGRTPSEEELHRWTSADVPREVAVVAICTAADGEQLVGVARYVMQSADETDFAIVLADPWQRRGLGRKLLEWLIATARERGVRKLSGVTLSTNDGMLSLGRALGFRRVREPDGFTTMLSLDLTPHPASS
jgi:GNAT superfamily N-acetyltransferase